MLIHLNLSYRYFGSGRCRQRPRRAALVGFTILWQFEMDLFLFLKYYIDLPVDLHQQIRDHHRSYCFQYNRNPQCDA